MTDRVDTVVFDIGNVLIAWDPRHLYRKVFATEAEVERFLAEVCTLEWHLAHDHGVSFEENALKLKALHPDHGELIDMWGGRYDEMIPGRIPGTADLLHALGDAGVALHGLTNMPVPTFKHLREAYPELQRLRTTVVSGDEGIVKPDPRIFELLIARAALAPQRTLFIDDSRANVDAAAKLGFVTHRFESAEDLRADLVRLGLIV
ncbi:MAG: HAD family phosphatase [Parvibaculum sp.]|uniref:HAD family hydrolase n=1 Tax=Parvibaculum sp. TaxID=2024848 RepID=UPI0025F0E9B4|nr:HAD family phosphatase [Parvibaculum sp.]MCE9649196.1 HAD family phosphatase [Parvibaculum sp.]